MKDEAESFVAELSAAAAPVGEALRSSGADTPDHDLLVLWMADVGRAIVAAWPRLSPAEKRSAFVVVEQHQASGSDRIATAVATGLLEFLVGQSERGVVPAAELRAVLGPMSLEHVDGYYRFTNGIAFGTST